MQSIWQQLSREISDQVSHAGRSVVAVNGRSGQTSAGIVWTPEFVLTSAASIRQDKDIGIIFEAGNRVSARLAGRDPNSGFALLKLEQKSEAVPAEFGPTDSLAVGELVVAIARTRRGNIVASSGILSGLMGEWQMGPIRIDQFIRPDLTLYSGFSGGALIGPEGKILGMTSAEILRGKSIAIPSSTLLKVAEELREKGHVATPYVGLVMQPVSIPEKLQKQSDVDASTGLLVMHVEESGPAETSGVLLGDILFDLHGQSFEDLGDLQSVLRRVGSGHDVKASLLRGGRKIELTISIGERPLR